MPEKLELTDHTSSVYCVCFSHDDTFIASSSADGSVKIWDLLTGEVRKTFRSTGNQLKLLKFKKKIIIRFFFEPFGFH